MFGVVAASVSSTVRKCGTRYTVHHSVCCKHPLLPHLRVRVKARMTVKVWVGTAAGKMAVSRPHDALPNSLVGVTVQRQSQYVFLPAFLLQAATRCHWPGAKISIRLCLPRMRVMALPHPGIRVSNSHLLSVRGWLFESLYLICPRKLEESSFPPAENGTGLPWPSSKDGICLSPPPTFLLDVFKTGRRC